MAIKQETDHGVAVPESYAKLFDSKVAYLEELKKLKKRFDSDATSLVKAFEETTTKLAESDANLSGEFKAKKAAEMKRREEELEQLKQELVQLSEALKVSIKAVEAVRKEQDAANQKSRQAAQKEHEKALKALESASAALTKEHAEKKNAIQAKYDAHMQQIEEAEKTLKEKLDADLALFENELAKSLKELETTTTNNIAKLTSTIVAETSSYEKTKATLLAAHAQELVAIDEKAKQTNASYDQQVVLIKESFNKSFEQQSNFLSKCEKENDVAGRDSHLAEIRKLKVSNAAELKQNDVQRAAALAIISKEKLEKLQTQARQLSQLNEEFLVSKLKNDHLVSVEKASLASETNRLNTEKEQKVNARFRVYQEALNTSAKERTLTLETKEVDTFEQEHAYEVQLESLENDKKIAKFKHDQALISLTEKDELTKLDRDAEIEKLKLDFALNEEKIHNKELLSKNALAYQLQQFEYDEVLAFYKNDLARQQSIGKDLIDYDGHFSSLEKAKTQQLSIYDEAEIRQRYEEKISVFKSGLELLDVQAPLIAKKVDSVFATELALYQAKIDETTNPLDAAKAQYKKDADAEIEKKQKERDQLLSEGKEKEKETNEMVKLINSMVSKKDSNLRQMDLEIKEKTKIFHDAIAGLAKRQESAIKETQAFVAKQKTQLEKSIQLLTDSMNTELRNREAYIQGNEANTSALAAFGTNLLASAESEHQSYLARRSETTQALISKLKVDFDAENLKQEGLLSQKVAKSAQQDNLNKSTLSMNTQAANKKRANEIAKVDTSIATSNSQYAAWKKQKDLVHSQQVSTTKQKTIQKINVLANESVQLMKQNSIKDADLIKQMNVFTKNAAKVKVDLTSKLETDTKQTKRVVASQLQEELRQLRS